MPKPPKWCPLCRSVHVPERGTLDQRKLSALFCSVAAFWKLAHRDEDDQEFRIRIAWHCLANDIIRAEATRRRMEGPMYSVICFDCRTPYQSYSRSGERCARCSMERD